MGLLRRDDSTLWLLVHTMTITEVDYQVRAQFVHAVLGGFLGTRLLARRVRMTVRPKAQKTKACSLNAPSLRVLMKRNSASIKHHVRTMQVDSLSSSKFSPSPSQAVAPSSPVPLSSKQQSPQSIIQVAAPLEQVQTSQELVKHETRPPINGTRITTNTTNEQVLSWLAQNRFQKLMDAFQNFNGHDLLRLSRNDILQICGEADGIRFFNVLHDKAVTPRSKIYVCISNNKVFHAVFLKSSTKEALTYELCDIVGLNPRVVQEVFMEGPKNIHVIVSDSVVYHIKEESAFSVSVHKEKEQYVLILKQVK